jgi:hypothetical protein
MKFAFIKNEKLVSVAEAEGCTLEELRVLFPEYDSILEIKSALVTA